MRKIYNLAILLILCLPAISQNQTATMKSSGRLFAMKDDLTTVITIVPADSVVTVLDSDSTYYHVVFQDAEGYIFKKQAVLGKPSTKTKPAVAMSSQNKPQQQQQQQQQQPQQQQQQQQSRFSYLENKYGTSMATKLYTGKIWKGMNAQMVNDSWGSAQKINRIIDGNTIKEEWIYNQTYLYFENSTLLEWGPIKK